jgi:phosphomannomutase
MGLLLIEMVASAKTSLFEMVQELQKEVGPVFYERTDLRLKHPVEKRAMVEKLEKDHPAEIGGEKIVEVSKMDGVKYIFADDSWLLIRPSGTEPVLRVYAEGRSEEMVKALMRFGETIAAGIT